MRVLPFLSFALLAATPGPGHSGSPWTVADLGHLHEEAHCMEAAERSLAHAARAFGGGALRRRGWSVEATGLAGGGHDAVITCTFGDNRGVRATLALHSREEIGRASCRERV